MARKQFNDFINENYLINGSTYTQREIDHFMKYWEQVQKYCKPFLRDLKKCDKLCLRGLDSSDDILRKKVRTDRWPKDMSIELHNAFDKVFKNIFNWNARSEGVFVSGSKSTSDSYGTSFIIFPINRYKILWSRHISDLYNFMDDIGTHIPSAETVKEWRRDYEDEYGENGFGLWYYPDNDNTYSSDKDKSVDQILNNMYDEYVSDFDEDGDDELIDKSTYFKQNEKYVERNLEWQPDITFENYYDVKFEDWTPSQDELYDICYDIVKGNNYVEGSLKDALESGNEVMLKCDEYFAFKLIKYGDLINHLLDGGIIDDPNQLSFDF